ncbi:MAG: hypothetical protein WBP21_07350, partial [Trichococcus flocculiformis]
QSPDIAAGVGSSLEKRLGSDDEADQLGAGDQGLMFGYACKETPELMPLPITLANKLAEKVTELRKSEELPCLRPDGKTQVTVEYADGHVKRIEAVVIACQHDESIDQERIREDMLRMVIPAVIRRSRWMIRRNISSMPPEWRGPFPSVLKRSGRLASPKN